MAIRKTRNARRNARRSSRKNTRRAQRGGGDCPKGGDHSWKRDNPKNMAGWCTCSKCGAKKSGGC